MEEFNNNFLDALKTGYIDKSLPSVKDYHPEFLVNDKVLGKKVLTSISRELKECDEFWFSVAFITTSGLAVLQSLFKELEEKGIKGRILVSQYLNFTQPEALRKLLSLTNIETRIAVSGNFHSKGYLFKKESYYNLIVGSTNLTASALSTNKEWNLKISATSESFIISHALKEFKAEFENAIVVDEEYITSYSKLYQSYRTKTQKLTEELDISQSVEIKPNRMQSDALNNLIKLREEDKRKALLISATGTGKTYLSAFDIKQFNPKRVLFVVHRENIAKAAMKSYKKIFKKDKTVGLYTGNIKDINADFIFSTVQTISKKEHMEKFDRDEFDYIVIDETHRAGAKSYQNVLDYFEPQFLLGMSATPERMDEFDIFNCFDYNIAHEIRLHTAMEEEMLSPFHYYGLTDITVDGKVLEEKEDFSRLTADERVDRIIEQVKFYGCDNGIVRGLVFCSRIEECEELSVKFNDRGYKTVALTGKNTEEQRESAIKRLESNDINEKIDYIFSVDIFNEGIDIPKVNQVVMLRPTQSAIVFVQQLGRGLRKTDNKEYLTVIDFIGNYEKNYLVPIALYGDTSYNKDRLRRLIAGGSSLIPGTSSVNFDKITRERIYQSIDTAKLQIKKDLVNDYRLLKYKLGRVPMMMDFIKYGARDPKLYVDYSKSYYNFVEALEKDAQMSLNATQKKLLELFAKEINNAKRVEESLILRELITNKELKVSQLKKMIHDDYGYDVSDEVISSSVRNLNFEFATEKVGSRHIISKKVNNLNVVKYEDGIISVDHSLKEALHSEIFTRFLIDNVDYSISAYSQDFDISKYNKGFILYKKYLRKDVLRILNWKQNEVGLNIGGYKVSADESNCPIFVNYHKEEDISDSTKYEDGFINNTVFKWMSKNKRYLNSREIVLMKDPNKDMRLPLFIKKHNDEGADFYYMGDMTPIDDSFVEDSMTNDNGKKVSVVKVKFKLSHPVVNTMYDYITNK